MIGCIRIVKNREKFLKTMRAKLIYSPFGIESLRPTSVGDRRIVFSFTNLMLVTLILFDSSLCFSSDDKSNLKHYVQHSNSTRPDVWWRPYPTENNISLDENEFWVPNSYKESPQNSPKVFVWHKQEGHSTKMASRRGQLMEFFSGETFDVISYDSITQFASNNKKYIYADGQTIRHEYRYVLSNGENLDLINITPDRSRYASDRGGSEVNESFKRNPPQYPFSYQLELISANGISDLNFLDIKKIWVTPTLYRVWALDQALPCDPLYYGLQARDHNGKVLWRRVFAAHGGLVPPPTEQDKKPYAYGSFCYRPGQYKLRAANSFSIVLNDETALLHLSEGILRIRVAKGTAPFNPSNVSNIDYNNLMRLKQVLWAQYNYRSDDKDFIQNNDIYNYMVLQAYVFPNIQIKK